MDDNGLVEKRRTQITSIAVAMFGRRGYHATTIRDIAQRAKVSVGLIYQYFEDKEDILFMAIVDILDSYMREIPKATQGIMDPFSRFESAVHAYCRVIDDKMDAALLAYRESKSLKKTRLNYVKEKELETNRLITTYIQDCIDAGVFRRVDVELFTYQIVIFVHSWALNAWRLPSNRTVSDYVNSGLHLMLNPVLVNPE